MLAKSKPSLQPQSFAQWPLNSKPLSLMEVLQLRDGLELSKKNPLGSTVQKVQPKLKLIIWNSFSLN